VGLAILIPLTIYALFALQLLDWVIDDAGISYAYARSLGSGAGLVSQQGMPPVEGYSNFLWVLLLSPLFTLGIFDPYYMPKIISLIFVGLAFLFTQRCIQRVTGSSFIVPLCVLLFIASNASFVIWTTSGLENALYAALVSLTALLLLKYASEDIPVFQNAGKIGAVVGLAALTRPDGAIYVLSFPMIILTTHRITHKSRLFEALKSVLGFLSAFTLLAGTYLLFRVVYFGALYPNTYYTKGGLRPSIGHLKLLLNSLFGGNVWIPISVVLLALVANAYLRRKRMWRQRVIIWDMCLLATATYILLPNDWMGEFRFATPFFLLLATAIAVEAKAASDYLTNTYKLSSSRRALLIGALLLAMFSISISEQYPRFASFRSNPVVALRTIATEYAYPFNTYAERLGLTDASLLTPDLGGVLFYSKLKVYDLAGLCDGTIARLHPRKQPAFYNYIFDTIKPTFIHTHGYFTAISEFDTDKRFARDYVDIEQLEDKYAERQLKRKVMSGNFVRRDALPDGEKSLQLLRQE